MKISTFISKQSIRKKILWAMLAISVIPILLQAAFTFTFSNRNMRSQLIQNKTRGIEWLNDKLDKELKKYKEFFYEIEIDKSLKKALISWSMGEKLDNSTLKEMRSIFEGMLNTNSYIHSVEIYNPDKQDGYIADRVSFLHSEKENLSWREDALQTNIVVGQEGNDYIITHQMTNLATKKRIALVVIRLSRYAFLDILEKDMEEGESAFLFNDRNELLGSYGNADENLEKVAVQMLHSDEEPDALNEKGQLFCFKELVDKGKLQLVYLVPGQWIDHQLKNTVMTALLILNVALVAATVLSRLFSNMISKPIVSLSKKMQTTDIYNFSAGDPVVREDEIGLLQESFESMICRNRELVEKEYQSELEKQEAQLKALQAQINPHFLYNTLQVIGGMAVTGQSKDIYPIVTALSDILRYAISFSEEMVALEQELTYLESYLAIQNSRFGNRIRFEKRVQPEAMDAYIPKLILQPIVENSLIHGLEGKSGEWLIALDAHIEGNTLILCVSDNGRGMDEEQLTRLRCALEKDDQETLTSSAHIGLRNVQARIRLQSGPGYGLELGSDGKNGTRITIRVHMEKRAEGEK